MSDHRIIGIASGCFWKFDRSPNRDALIKYVAETGVEGIELTFYGINGLKAFFLSDSSREYLKMTRFTSIHSPDLKRIKNKRQEMYAILCELEKLYYEIEADYIVFHPDSIKDYGIFRRFSFNTAIENLDKDKRISDSMLLKILTEHPDLWFCLDVAHAYSWSEDETSFLVEKLKKRVSHIHLSGSDGERCHLPLNDSQPRYMNSLRIIKEINVPIIIEEDIPPGSVSSFKQDLIMGKRLDLYL